MGSLRLNLSSPSDRERMSKIFDRSGRSLLDKALEEYAKSSTKETTLEPEPKPQHFRASKFWKDGIYWHSKWEYECWLILQELDKRGLIKDLKRQVKFEFEHNEVLITTYRADFVFSKDSHIFVADAKHRETEKSPRWRLVKKCMKAWYGIDVLLFYKGETDVEKEIHML